MSSKRRHSADPIDRLRADTRALIDRFGFTKLMIGTGECSVPGCDCVAESYPYAYTLGMCEHDSPEFVTFGVPSTHVASIVDPICNAVIDGVALPLGRECRIDLGGDGPLVSLVPVPDRWFEHDPDRIGSWHCLFRTRTPSFVQICWGDEDDRMPWEPACNPAVVAVQPVLADDPISFPRLVD